MKFNSKKWRVWTCLFIILLLLSSCSSESSKLEKNHNETSNSHPAFVITNNWGIDAINYETSDIPNIRIGVIDSANYYQSPNVTNYSVHNLENLDTNHHGSFIVSSLCSLLPTTKIISINVADENGNISGTALANGILYAVEQKCNVISVSLGTQKNYTSVENAVKFANEQGCIIVAAAGNETQTNIDYPARYDNVISVMSRNIDNIDDRTNNISKNKKSFSAPGSIVFNDIYVFTGSSISTVYVTAEVAYILNRNENALLSNVKNILEMSSVFSTAYSYGMINHTLVVKNSNIQGE